MDILLPFMYFIFALSPMLAAANINGKVVPSLPVCVTQGKAPCCTRWLKARIFT